MYIACETNQDLHDQHTSVAQTKPREKRKEKGREEKRREACVLRPHTATQTHTDTDTDTQTHAHMPLLAMLKRAAVPCEGVHVTASILTMPWLPLTHARSLLRTKEEEEEGVVVAALVRTARPLARGGGCGRRRGVQTADGTRARRGA